MKNIAPQINIGIVGHVDHGKTTLTKTLSGNWTDTHSEERKKKITIKLGYTNFEIYDDDSNFNSKKKGKFLEKYSIVDSPGHESFMGTMISGCAVMDYALLVICADEKCPMPQTIEHVKALEISGIENVIIIQNKIDLVSKEDAIKNYEEIENFIKNTHIKNSKIIPISAYHEAGISNLLKEIYQNFKPKKRDDKKELLFSVIKSFDINKPGISFEDLKGGVIGCSIRQGEINIGDNIELRPGIMKNKEGKIVFEPIISKVVAMMSNTDKIDIGKPGGSIAISTELDPVLTKNDLLVGQVGGHIEKVPKEIYEIEISVKTFDKVLANKKEFSSKPFIIGETLMLIVNALSTIGVIKKISKDKMIIALRRPVIVIGNSKIVIFRNILKSWKLCGYGEIL